MNKLSDALRIAKLYSQRWGCEEGIRFLKQALSIEDIRVQSYRAFRQLIILAHLSALPYGIVCEICNGGKKSCTAG